MDVLYRRCVGIDVHQKSLKVCLRCWSDDGKPRQIVRTFGTMTRELLALADWLAAEGVTHVAMESTGVLWKPVFNILEGRFEVLLVNAQHIKQVPGRKTDVKDCEWIAQLLQHGLLRASFVPPRPMRELRDLTRHRAKLAEEHTAVANRIHKTLEDANIKLGAVASDVLGVSGRAMIEALIVGEQDADKMAELARRQLRKKIPQLRLALEGNLTEHHRFMLRMLWDHLRSLEAFIEQVTARIEEQMRPFAQEIERLATIPGIRRVTAQNLIAEVGPDMKPFPSSAHLASWAGVCPGNHESAGKRKRGKTAKGNRWLRRALCQAAWAAQATRGTYLAAQYRRLAARRGKQRAIVAVSHSLLHIVYHVLARGTNYVELGPTYFDQLNPQHLTRYLVKRLQRLGHEVTLTPKTAA